MFRGRPADNSGMSRGTTWALGLIVGIVGFHVYTKRVDTGDLPAGEATASATAPAARGGGVALSSTVEGPGAIAPAPEESAAGAAGAAGGAGAWPAFSAAGAGGADGGAAGPIDASAAALASTLHAQALDLLRHDEPKGALLLYRVARARTNAPEREDAARRLAALEEAARERALRAKQAGALEEERHALSVAYLACLDPDRRAPLRARLDELTQDVVFSPRASGAAHSHTVKPGESLVRIAAKYDFPAEGIQRVNKLRSTVLRVGERLKVPKGPVELIAAKGEFRLTLLFGGLYAREFRIGTGRGGCTPEASFAIDTKIERPTYFSREGTFPFGHEKNILGTRWLGFKSTDEHKGFGIHGTRFPESVGREESSGCIRLRNEDVEDLFAWIPKGTSVTIVR
jgi:LysM repeat protein